MHQTCQSTIDYLLFSYSKKKTKQKTPKNHHNGYNENQQLMTVDYHLSAPRLQRSTLSFRLGFCMKRELESQKKVQQPHSHELDQMYQPQPRTIHAEANSRQPAPSSQFPNTVPQTRAPWRNGFFQGWGWELSARKHKNDQGIIRGRNTITKKHESTAILRVKKDKKIIIVIIFLAMLHSWRILVP